jgi:hypothetical protein
MAQLKSKEVRQQQRLRQQILHLVAAPVRIKQRRLELIEIRHL